MKPYSALFSVLVLLYASTASCEPCDLHSNYEEVSECRMLYEALERALVTEKNNLYLLREYFLSQEFYHEVLYVNYNVILDTEDANLTNFSYQTGYSKFVLFTITSPNILGSLTAGMSWFGADWTNLTLDLTNETLDLEFGTQDLKRTLDAITTRLNVYATQHVVSYYNERIDKEDLGYTTIDSHEDSNKPFTEVFNIAIIAATILIMAFTCHRLFLSTFWFIQTIKTNEKIHPLKVYFYMSMLYSSGFILLSKKATELYMSIYVSKWKYLPQYFNTIATLSSTIVFKIENILFGIAIIFAFFGGIMGYVAYVRIDPLNLSGHKQFPSVLLKLFFCFNFATIYYFVYEFSQNIVPSFLMALVDPLRVILISTSAIGVITAGLVTYALLLFPFITSSITWFSRIRWMCRNGPLSIPVYVTSLLLIISSYTWTTPIRTNYHVLTQVAAAAFPYVIVGIIGYLNKGELFRLLSIDQTRGVKSDTNTSLSTIKEPAAKELTTDQELHPLLNNADEITSCT